MRGHRNPNCPCLPCTARRRKAEAIAIAAGNGGAALVPESEGDAAINADQPQLEDFVHLVEETGTPRAYVARWLQLRMSDPDITLANAARQLKVGRKTLEASIAQAVEEGWIKFTDPLAKVEFEIMPKVVRNLNHFLDDFDKTVTIEAAKGTLFPAFKEARGISEAPATILALKIEAPPEGGMTAIQGQIIGRSRLEEPISTEDK